MTQRDRDYDDFYDDLNDDLNDNEYLDEYDELFFDDDEPPEVGEQLPDFEIERHQSPERTQHAGLTGASLHADTSTLDDASPETLLPDDGARSPDEAGGEGTATDQRLSKTRVDNIGAGSGLDEAELARAQPLDERPWDDDAKQGPPPATEQERPRPSRH